MVSPVHQSVAPERVENNISQAPARAAKRPPAKPQPAQDTVRLNSSSPSSTSSSSPSSTRDANRDGDSKK